PRLPYMGRQPHQQHPSGTGRLNPPRPVTLQARTLRAFSCPICRTTRNCSMAYYQQPLDVTTLPAWQALLKHRQEMQGFSMREAFASDAGRFERFSMSTSGIFLDYSKNLLSEETLGLLVDLTREAGLQDAIEALFNGERVNASEGRPALHTALRRPIGDCVKVDGVNVMPEVHRVLNQMTDIVSRIHSNLWRGYSEKTITDVVNIGIGGSFLGPQLVSEALLPFTQHGVRC